MVWRRRAIWISVVFIVIITLALGLQPQAVLITTQLANRSLMQMTIDEEGRTRVKDRFVISAPVSGYIRRIDLHVADAIKKQQVLTQLEPLRSEVLDPRSRANASAKIAAAKSSLLALQEKALAAQADAEFSEQEYKRKTLLKSSQSISEEQLSQAKNDQRRTAAGLRSANFDVDVARYNVEAASTLLQYSAAKNPNEQLTEHVAIQSPIDGNILFIHHESEGVVQLGEPLIEVGDPKALEVIVDVLSFDAVQIAAGMKVNIKHWGGPTIEGQVRVVEPIGFTEVSALGVEEQRVWVIVDITSAPTLWDRLGDGYRVEATFYIWQQDNILQVPNSSLFRYQDGWALYVVNNNKAELREISIGRRNGLNTQILKGVEEAERVITHPDNSLEPGVRVRET